MADTSDHYLEPNDVLAHLGLAAGQQVGDFGVGGAATFAMAASALVGADGRVVMFDVNKSALSSALAMAKLRGATNCQGVWSNLELYGGATGVADGSLDAGLLINVLDQSAKHKDIVAEAGRMLKSGAKLIVVDWLADVTLPIAPESSRRVTAEQIAQEAKTLGFASVETFAAGPYHWGLVLVKT